MNELTHEEMIAAMANDDSAYNGRFYVCVRSTHIYCLPSCTAKDPLFKNVVFHRSKEEAIAAGFRGCLRCRSEFFPDVAPLWLGEVLAFMKKSIHDKIGERDIAKSVDVDISTVRRYFKS